MALPRGEGRHIGRGPGKNIPAGRGCSRFTLRFIKQCVAVTQSRGSDILQEAAMFPTLYILLGRIINVHRGKMGTPTTEGVLQLKLLIARLISLKGGVFRDPLHL